MPIPDRYEKMLVMLLESTVQGRSDWKEITYLAPDGSTERSSRFRVELKTAWIEVSKTSDEYSGDTMKLKILDKNEQLLDQFEVSRGEPSFSEVVRLYDLALPLARNLGSVIEGIEKELGG